MLTSLPAVDVLLSENGHPGYVVVSNRAGMKAGAVVDLHSSAHDHLGLKVQDLEGREVHLWDPVAEVAFDASAFLAADGAHLVQAAQDLYGGLIRDFFVDSEETQTPLATAELADILLGLLPGGATLPSNVAVTNFPAQQHVVVDNTITTTTGSTQNTGTLTAATQTVALPLTGRAGAAIGITGVWAGTIVFEASVDAGVTWFSIEAYNPDSAHESVSTSTTANGVFQPMSLAGVTHIRARASLWTSGTASLYLSATGTPAELLAPNVRENGAAAASYGAMVAGLDGGGLTRFVSVDTSGRISVNVNGTVPVSGTFFQATQPVSAAALPLPSGASTAATQTDGSQKAQVVQGGNTLVIDASGRISVNVNGTVPISGSVAVIGTVPVSGTFFQATQPVSAAALPLPSGASTEATLATLSGNNGAFTKVDSNNSTATPLTANTTWQGTATDSLGYVTIVASIFTDQAGTLTMQESSDGVNWDITAVAPITAMAVGEAQTMSHTVLCRYFRVAFTCGPVGQTAFRFQTILMKGSFAGDMTDVGGTIYAGMKGQLVKAVLSGRTPPSEGNVYREVAVDTNGSLLVEQGNTQGVFGGLLTVNEMVHTTLKSAYPLNSRNATTATANGGSVTWADSMTTVATGTNATGMASVQTREAVRYVPGQGNIARLAPAFVGGGIAGSRGEGGFLTDTDGFGFGYNGTQFGILIRKNSIDTWVLQAVWNGDDRFDGTTGINNPSGVNVDWTKMVPLQIAMQWLGGGAVRWYVESPITGDFVLVHTYKYAGTQTTPSINQPNLPVRLKVINTGSVSNLTASITSMAGLSEGVQEVPDADVRFDSSNQVATIGTGGVEILAIRNKTVNIYGGTNVNTINTHIDRIGIRASATGDLFVELILNPTQTGVSYADKSTATSVMQVDTAGAYTVGTGTVLATIPVASNTSYNEDLTKYNIRLVPGDVLLARCVSEIGTVSCRVALGWHEET